jgi:hypothetical protein
VTVTIAVAEVPAVLVTVSVNVAFAPRVPVPIGVPLATLETPWSTTPSPPLNFAVRVVLFPALIVWAAAVKLSIVGIAATVTIVC